jgi:transposase
MRILVATKPVDFRNGIDGLAVTCRKQLKQDLMTARAFVFRNRKRTPIKILLYWKEVNGWFSTFVSGILGD